MSSATIQRPDRSSLPAQRTGGLRRRRRGRVAQYAALLVMFAVLAGPLLWQLSLSLKGQQDDIYAQPPKLLPAHPTLDNFTNVFDRLPILEYIGNSAFVAALVVGGNVLGAAPAGYALARLRFRGRGIVLAVVIGSLLVPIESVIISQFLLVRELELTDTLVGVALPSLVTALNVLLMRNAFLNLPPELEEAARIDGANAWRRFLSVSLPQVKGVVAVVAIFSFVGAWNDFLWPLLVLTSDDNYTLTVGLNRLRGTFVEDPRLIAAGTIIALVPIVVFFAAIQRYFFRGLQSGGLKG